MKRNIILFVVIALTCGIVACYDDKGSYDYHEVNEVEVDELGDGYSMIFKKDTLKITPKLNFSMDSLNPDRYEYEWKAVPGLSNENPGGIIGTSRNLNYFIELYPGSYSIYLKVRDKQTGLLWMNYTSLTVRTEVSRGFLLVGEDEEGYVDVDMISMPGDTIVLKSLLANNGLPPMKGARGILYTGAYTASMDPYVKLWVMSEERSYYVNTTTFEGDPLNTFERMVYSSFDMPEEMNPVHFVAKSRAGAMSTNRMVVCDNGYVFMASLYSGDFYANPMNRASKTQDVLFKAYPYIFSAPGYVYGAVLYDTDDNRFLRFGTFDTYSRELSDAAGDVFPWIQPEGRMLWYAENTMDTEGGSSNGNSFALMKDTETGQFHIYKFYAYSSALKRGYYEIKSSLATDLARAELFAFSSKRTLFMYAVGSKLYAYDYNKGYEKLYSMDMGDEITMLKFDLQADGTYNDLYVATYNSATGGTLQKYTLGTDQNTFELKPDERCCWTGLVKVKDMDWRNSTK
ncbi:PKD-like family lipoprotein [Odoribacter sp. AF15-53]|uniref:PKD-like family lipoprotein n=1 Tax=Odoribacter sp. AF15-53 TaxID=2292236 RepID=UPI000E49BFBB|nr:PKD-like family lipoprotein [Odoribacter sp. AF15-53]RHR79029.1 hypothetical protein DWW52_10660 [Odoribacter sp. AF15-53]